MQDKEGFTLVELAVVLVIIGLLIGGILVAQSMIHAANINTFIRKLQQFDIAVSNFQTKYNQLPGDSSAFGCTNGAHNTCDNGLIEDLAFTANRTDRFSAESANFWVQLQQSGFISNNNATYTKTVSGAFAITGANPNSPSMPLGTTTGVIPVTITTAFTALYSPSLLSSNQLYYAICNFTADTSGLSKNIRIGTSSISNACGYNATIPVADALAIDTKIDDGLSEGNWDMPLDNVNVIDYGYWGNGQINCSAGDNYGINNPAGQCSLLVKMLSQTGAGQ